MELYQLGTTETEPGTWNYDPDGNPLLQKGVTSDGIGASPNYFATPEAAEVLADLAGGAVVPDPLYTGIQTTETALAIQTGDTTVNAGNVLAVMGNDCGFANAAIKSVEMCKMLGIAEDRAFADKLWTALGL